MSMEFEIFTGKSFKDLCEDIVSNQEKRKQQVEALIGELRPLIKTVNDAMIVVPLIKSYMDVGIHNDEHLVRLAAIIQKIISSKVESGNGDAILSDKEKEELLKQVEKEVEQIEQEQSVMIKSLRKSKE